MIEQRIAPVAAADGELNVYAATVTVETLDTAQLINDPQAEEVTVVPSEHAELQLAADSETTNDGSNPADAPETNECCASANPLVTLDIALVVLIVNILVPGVGSMVAAYYDPKGCNSKCGIFGILQLLLAVIIVGWIWSIVQGVAIYKKSHDYYSPDFKPIVINPTLDVAPAQEKQE